MGNNWYCNFVAAGDPIEVERLRKGLDEHWCRVEIKDDLPGVVSASTSEWDPLAAGWDIVEEMVEQFPVLNFTGTLYTTFHREYQYSFEGRDGATTWETSYDEGIAKTEAQIRAYYAADNEMVKAIHKKVYGYQGMSEAEIAEIEAQINAYYAAFRERELVAAREEEARAASEPAEVPMTRAERAHARAELAQKMQDILKRLSASSPTAETHDSDRS